MPMCTAATREEHHKRPPSGKQPQPPSAECKNLRELIDWANAVDPEVQFQGARSLADLAMTSEERPRIVQAGGLQPLVRLLHSDRAEIQLFAVMAVANLALDDANQGLLAAEGALDPLIHLALRVSAVDCENVEMQINIARALANMAYCHESNEDLIVRNMGLKPIIFLSQSIHHEVRLEAVAALANLARNKSNQRNIVEQGALGPLVKAMQGDEEELQGQAARCLANVSLNEGNQGDIKVCVLCPCLCVCKRERDTQRERNYVHVNLLRDKEELSK